MPGSNLISAQPSSGRGGSAATRVAGTVHVKRHMLPQKRTRQIVATATWPGMCGSQTHVRLEAVVDTVAEPAFWWKPLWKLL